MVWPAWRGQWAPEALAYLPSLYLLKVSQPGLPCSQTHIPPPPIIAPHSERQSPELHFLKEREKEGEAQGNHSIVSWGLAANQPCNSISGEPACQSSGRPQGFQMHISL